jgi:hypothetical protein
VTVTQLGRAPEVWGLKAPNFDASSGLQSDLSIQAKLGDALWHRWVPPGLSPCAESHKFSGRGEGWGGGGVTFQIWRKASIIPGIADAVIADVAITNQ